LAQTHRLSWDRVEIFFGDERAVPPGDPQSNYRMARESLLDAVPIPSRQVHRMPAERPDRDAAAAEYAAQLPARLDLIILGIGADGHTASLFPGSAALEERARKVMAVEGPRAPRRRLTVTPPVITSAVNKIVLAGGSEKAGAVARALEGPDDPDACPAQLARDGIWIVDSAAASGLRKRP
jgi:6-phosphogluconolactonase